MPDTNLYHHPFPGVTGSREPPGGVPATAIDGLTTLPDYMIDALQRSILFLDLMRQRGNEQIEITSRPMATVLSFGHEVLMDGRSLSRPINYALSRIMPPPGVVIDPAKRPVVVVDPRAGQGPGVGGFKTQSEIGDALNAGHPVYFIGFGAIPVPGQQFLDIVEGQVKFFERVVALHPDAPRPFAIGNCQAGYQTLMVAILRPDLFGPCLVAGSPMSYWQGVHGKNPMRYAGGLFGGSWITALMSDLGNGKIDGTSLILNFDILNPANWLWGKQYEVYTHVDTDKQRYLRFEEWWGDFIELNGDELQFLVDNLFIGDRLTRNQLQSSNGTVFDLRSISSPIIVFTSVADNVSPPPQTLGWILDLYQDADDIRAKEQTIVYCVSQVVGHLAIFVSSKVGAKEDEEFVQLMDVIDCLPPGLHEMIISPRPANVPVSGFATGDWIARFEARSLDDIRALGRNSPADDRAFAAVARLSEANLSLYRTWMQPFVRALANQAMADVTKALDPLRLSYTMFADGNPWMKGVERLAASVTAARRPVAADNPMLAVQARVSEQITTALDAYRDARDTLEEKTFFGIYGSPSVQALLGIDENTVVRPIPIPSPEALAAQRARMDGYTAKLAIGGFDEALIRAVVYVLAADRRLDQRCALALNGVRQQLMRLSLAAFKAMVRDQFFVLQLQPDRAIEALASLVPQTDARKDLLKQVRMIASAGDPLSTAENDRLTRLSKVLASQWPAFQPPRHPGDLRAFGVPRMQIVVNKTFDEIAAGDTASAERTLQAGDIRAWGAAFEEPGESTAAAGIVTAMLTALVGSTLPGPGSSIRAASVQIKGTLPIGGVMTLRLVVREKRANSGIVVLDGECIGPAGQIVASAILEVRAPATRQQRQVAEHRLEGLIERCRNLKPMLTGVVHPCSADALAGAVEAAEAALIIPVLYGPEAEIRRIADLAHLDIARYRIVSADSAEDSAAQAAIAAGRGEVAALMKGSLHTDVLLHAIMQKEAKLRTGRLISHCTMMSVPTYARRFVLSDVALNIAPDTDQKRDICQNAIGFARALGIDLPKLAVLAAVETVRTKMPATIDAAILAKMADRRQIVGGIVDGPLDLDAAVDAEAARIKRITSPVAGLADVLIVPEYRGRQHGLQESRLHGRCTDRRAGGWGAGAGDPDQPRRHRRRTPLLGRRRRSVRRRPGARSFHPVARNCGVTGHERSTTSVRACSACPASAATCGCCTLRFSTTDTGIGIPAAKLARIFEGFTRADSSTTRRFGGSGLGLTISKSLVQLMGGHIWVESVIDKGSSFSFSLPFDIWAQAAGSAEEPVDTGPAAPLRALRILLAEDSPDNRTITLAYLEDTPYRLDIAENGAVACDMFQADGASSQAMPVGG